MNFLAEINAVEFVAVFVAAVTGIVDAQKKKMDIVGVFFVGFVTALGGGTLRDILIDRHPVFWMRNEIYPAAILFLSVLSLAVIKPVTWNHVFIRRFILFTDAVSLSLFSIVGAKYGFDANCSTSVCVIMGLITGTFGGVIRDILCNEIPMLFRSTQVLYATCSFFGTVVFCVMMQFDTGYVVAAWSGSIVILVTRIASIIYGIHLPKQLSSE